MFRTKLLTSILLVLPLYLKAELVLAADSAAAVDDKASTENSKMDSDKPDKREESKENSSNDSKKDPKKVAATEKAPPNLAFHSSFGIIRAFHKKKNLRANGFADIKASYLTSLWKKRISATFHYLPFAIAPDSGTDTSFQGYKGTVEVYTVGVSADFSLTRYLNVLSSLEVGAFRSNLTELIPTTPSQKPLSRTGTVALAGASFLFNPLDKFKVGPRLTVGGGTISLLSFAIDCSFYF